MSQLEKQNSSVFRRGNNQCAISNSEISSLKMISDGNTINRSRICIHHCDEDTLQQMVINLNKQSYVMPAKHMKKEETLLLLEGRAKIIFFSVSGNVDEVVDMNLNTPNGSKLIVIPKGIFHSILAVTDSITFVETTLGPFRAEETEYAEWAPCEMQPQIGINFLEEKIKIFSKS